jgi:hypothetical protein
LLQQTNPELKVWSSKNMDNNVYVMADFVKKYVLKAIMEDTAIFEKLAKIRTIKSFQLNVEWKNKHIERYGKPAWKRKNYTEVVKIYSSWEPFLNEEEKQQLEYAREQLNQK